MLFRLFVALGLVAGALGDADAQPSATAAPPLLDLTAAGTKGKCKPGAADEVVVCGDRSRSPYRIDPKVLGAIRAKEAAMNPSRVADRSGDAELCGTGSNECTGGTVPLVEAGLRVAAAAVNAAQGEDWREPFRNGPSDYQRYEDAKAKRVRVSAEIGTSGKRGD